MIGDKLIPKPLRGITRAQSPAARWRKRFFRQSLTRFSLAFIFFLSLLAVFADFLANEKPLAASIEGELHFPVMRQYAVDLGLAQWPESLKQADWKALDYDWAVFPPVPYLPRNIDLRNLQSVSPMEEQRVKSRRWRHWLGTDELGHDVLAAMIHGTRYAMAVGIVSMAIAGLIGVLLGSLAGFFGNSGVRLSAIRIILNLLFLFPAWLYAFDVRAFQIQDAGRDSILYFLLQLLFSVFIFSVVMLVANLLASLLERFTFFRKRYRFPIDSIISRLIEVTVSIPSLFLIISVLAVAGKPSLLLVMAVIGLTSWAGIARLVRAEMLRIRELEYIQAVRVLGLSELKILWRHALPNALGPAIIMLAFGMASAILAESTLSFLGIGVPAETLTWGSLLSAARENTSSWWLAVFPGFAIFLTVMAYNLIGEALSESLQGN